MSPLSTHYHGLGKREEIPEVALIWPLPLGQNFDAASAADQSC